MPLMPTNQFNNQAPLPVSYPSATPYPVNVFDPRNWENFPGATPSPTPPGTGGIAVNAGFPNPNVGNIAVSPELFPGGVWSEDFPSPPGVTPAVATAIPVDQGPQGNVPGVTFVGPATPPPGAPGSNFGGPQGPLYANQPTQGGFLNDLGMDIRDIISIFGSIPAALASGIPAVVNAISRGMPNNMGGLGQPAGYFGVPSSPGIGQFGVNAPSFNVGGGISPADVLASGVTPRFTSGTIPAPGGWGGTFGQGSAGNVPAFWGWQNFLRGMKFGFTPNVVGAGIPINNPVGQWGQAAQISQGAIPSYASIGQYYSPNAYFAPGGGGAPTGFDTGAGHAGPGGRSMSAQ